MIRVNRGEPPQGFATRAELWRERFRNARIQDPTISAAKFWKSIRSALRSDAAELAGRFHAKCAYCESRMRHVSYPHIEHYRPKGQARFENLMFEWSNWLLSCGVCNDEKWTDFPETEAGPLLLNPTSQDPIPHIGFKRSMIYGLSASGIETISLVGLKRLDLERERGSWLATIDALLLLAVESQDPNIRTQSREFLIWAMQDDAPYAAMTRQYLSEKCPDFANPATPHPTINGAEIQQRISALVREHENQIRQIR